MSDLIRLVYVSRSTFTPGAAHQGLDPSVARILAKSRKNNAAHGIVGCLLFGDGCFLQCLEGDGDAVDALYGRIAADPRHRDVTVLSRRDIVRSSFAAWSMKYAPGEATLRRLTQSLGMNRFDPYAMSPEDIDAAVTYMEREAESASAVQGDRADRSETSARATPASPIDPSAGRHARQGNPSVDAGARTVRATGLIAGALILIALLGWGYFALRG